MIFSTNILDEIYNKQTEENVDTKKDVSHDNLFEYGLDMMLEEDKVFMTTLVYEGIVLDAIKSIDICDILGKVFKLFINAINNLFKQFKKILVSMINKDPRIHMYKDKLKDWDGSYQYNRTFYGYKNLFEDNSFNSYQIEINKEYDRFAIQLNDLRNARNPILFAQTLNSMNVDDRFDDIIRGKLVGTNGYVDDTEFADKLYHYFRPFQYNRYTFNGKSDKVLEDAYNNYFDNKAGVNAAHKYQSKLASIANAVSDKIKKESSTNNLPEFVLADDNGSLKVEYQNMIFNKCKRIKDINHIYAQYYSAKLDAIVESYKSSRDILAAIVLEIAAEKGGK